MLTRSFPPETVDEVVAAQGRTEQRSRLLPARLVVYYVMALALFASEGYEEVMRQLVAGLAWTTRWRGTWRVPSSPAISKARTRLGPAVLAALFDRVCVPVAAPDTAGAFYRSWRLVAVDGTTFDAPDEAVNTARFGKPSNDQGTGAFPQVRVVALAECGTHAVFAAALAGITTGEQDAIPRAAGQDRCGNAGAGRPQLPGPPTVGRRRRDRGGPAVAGQVRHPTARGHRTRRGLLPVLPGRARHPRTRPADHRARHRVHPAAATSAYPHKAGEVYRLVTTILDPDLAPAEDLATAYAQRWEIESVLDEIKTHQLQSRPVLRSRDPDGVEQEIWGILLVHHAIRDLIHLSARDAGLDPDRVSFTRALRAARRQVTDQAGLSPLPTTPRHPTSGR